MASSSVIPFRPIYVTAFELTDAPRDLVNLESYRRVRALARLHGSPLGFVDVPVIDGCCAGSALRRAAIDTLAWPMIRRLLIDQLRGPIGNVSQPVKTLGRTVPPEQPAARATITVAVCTRDRAADLSVCLASLLRLDPPPCEILVVDNASGSCETRELVASWPSIRYVREDRPGLDWARSRAVLEATGDIVAFTDDDVVVDRRWVGALQHAFADPDVAAVTGLVLPYELETESQELFERYGGFGRGFERRWYRVDAAGGERASTLHGGTGKFGTGANMAFRRTVLDAIGLFDPALDVGTITNGGGDLEMFYRVLATGHQLLYEPDAIVWHRHRREYMRLRDQIANNGVGFYAYLACAATAYPGEWWTFARLGLAWLWQWNLRRLLQALYKPGLFPRDLVIAELAGSVRGITRYARAKRRARDVDAAVAVPFHAAPRGQIPDGRGTPDTPQGRSVIMVDIADGTRDVPEAAGHPRIDVVVLRRDRLIGRVTITNRRLPVAAARLREEIVNALGVQLLADGLLHDAGALWQLAVERLHCLFGPPAAAPSRRLNPAVDVSVVIASRDRRDDLRAALRSIAAVRTDRRVEVIVVDNYPACGVVRRVLQDFPTVTLVEEPRPGLSYARNAGIGASSGAIVIATDDDVVVPPHWIEALVAPFRDPDVMVVTGNVLPWDLSARPQQLFEAYGGLGRGATPFRVDGRWFWSFRRAVPTWTLGGTANAAFRAAIFHDSRIGLLDESLGAGTPAGCSEDTDLFYRVLRAGFTLAYEPQAFVWHRHRDTTQALRRQIYAYAKGHVAYQLTTLVRDGDCRALTRLALELPRVYAWRVWSRLGRCSDYPLALVAVELAGTLMGPYAWLRSRLRTHRLGRSAPYVPAPARPAAAAVAATLR